MCTVVGGATPGAGSSFPGEAATVVVIMKKMSAASKIKIESSLGCKEANLNEHAQQLDN